MARREVGLETMEVYIRQRQNTVMQYISTLLLLEICEATERKQGPWVGMRCWEQVGIYLSEAREMTAAAEDDGM